MAGNARFESPSASSSEPVFSGAYSNGKRGTVGPNLDKSVSFREGAESRLFGSGSAASRGGNGAVVVSGNLPPLSQCLSLEPIVMGDEKITRSGELRRVMGLFIGSTTEENSSGAAVPARLNSSPPVAVAEDLKRFRSSVVDTCITARGRASKLDEHLHKLDKYCDGVITKKPQRNELMNNDQAGALNSKIGTQIYRNPSELLNQRVDDRPKNVLMNKRVRTSVAETRAELRTNGLRRQPLAMAKDRDLLKDNGGESDMFEEKIRRLPAGGEGWDKKMKRKRSVGAVFTRPMDSNGEPKRTVQNKVVSELGMQSNDAHPYRLGASNGTSSTYKLDNKPDNKLEVSSLPNNSRARMSPRTEPEGPSLPRDLPAVSNKERILAKGNNKLNNRDDNYTTGGSPVTKGKASRTPRGTTVAAASSAPSTPRVSGTPETWENASKIPSTGVANNRKRAMPTCPSSPSMAQWVGQRPQKMSRTRRANLVSPVSNQEEKQLSSDSCSPSDVSVRLASDGTNGSLISKYAASGPQQFKVKLEPVQSPHRLSESEESLGGESRLKDKKGNSDAVDANDVADANVGPSLALGVKNNKPSNNEESGEGVRRQGRTGRGPLIARATGEKLDNGASIKPVRSNRPGCEKNGSKPGRPSKKLSDRKGYSRLGHLQNNGYDCTGKSVDDREELLAAANHARNASYRACSSVFWKKMEPLFAPVSSKDKFYLSVQLNSEQEIQESFPQSHGRENNVVVGLLHEETSVYDTHVSRERNGHVKHQGSESFSGRLDSDKTSREFIPLYQRVLSALIIEDNVDDLEEDEDMGNIRLQDAFFNSSYDTPHINDYDPRKRPRREIEFGVHAQNPHSVKNSISSNGFIRNPSVNNSPCEDVHSEVELLAGISKNCLNRPQVLQLESFGISSFDNQYEQMRLEDKLLLELQSIGLYPESVPNLDDKEDEAIKHEIDQLKTRLRQQNGKKKAYLQKICKGVERISVSRDLEQVAIDRLVELAYRKLLATRGASKGGIPRVPKQAGLAFGRRTLARCRKFGKSGTSCFNVPLLRDILFAPRENEPEPPTVASPRYPGYQNPPVSRLQSGVFPRPQDGAPPNTFINFNNLSDEAFAINGPISNRGKKKQLLLDDVVGNRNKTRTKPKQNAAQPPRPVHPVQPSRNGPVVHNGPQETSKDVMDPLNDLDPIDELGGPQDLSSLLNFDEEDLQDHYSAGLDIPMDDLSELNMF